MPDTEWLTVAECAGEVRVAKMTIYRLIDNGTLPVTRVGRSVRIRRTDWDAYLASVTT